MARRWNTRAALMIALGALSISTSALADSFVIVNARLVDGTGAAAKAGALRVRDGRIVALGDLVPARGEAVVDARGQVLAPGFIDTHSHHDRGLDKLRDALTATSQGITTIVVGQDGFSEGPLRQVFGAFARAPAALNLASYSGHNTLRASVLGKDFRREASAAEVKAMQRRLADDMRAGSLGLSTGLEYDPGIYSARSEVIALARTAAAHQGRYISHIRSEDVGLDAALDEIIEVGRAARLPVQVSHMKLALVDRWGSAGAVLARLDKARGEGIDITADVYPYEYWQSNLTVMFPKRDFTDLAASEFALTHLSTPEGMLISGYAGDPSLVGKTIGQIAAARGKSPAQTYLDLINASPNKGEDDMVIGTSMRTDDVANLLLWPHSNVSSDGMLVDRHPRGAGSFTKVLAWLVRREGRLSLESAVAKMTGLAARHMGFADRGTLAPGMAADLVLFDPATVADRATIADPGALSAGISKVWVNGQLVYADGQATTARPGKVLRRKGR